LTGAVAFQTIVHALCISTARILSSMPIAAKRFQPEWRSSIFNYGRNEVRAS